jgi:hypothetical protein
VWSIESLNTADWAELYAPFLLPTISAKATASIDDSYECSFGLWPFATRITIELISETPHPALTPLISPEQSDSIADISNADFSPVDDTDERPNTSTKNYA